MGKRFSLRIQIRRRAWRLSAMCEILLTRKSDFIRSIVMSNFPWAVTALAEREAVPLLLILLKMEI